MNLEHLTKATIRKSQMTNIGTAMQTKQADRQTLGECREQVWRNSNNSYGGNNSEILDSPESAITRNVS